MLNSSTGTDDFSVFSGMDTYMYDEYLYFGSGMNLSIDDNTIVPTCDQEKGIPVPFPRATADIIRYIQTTYYLVLFPIGVLLNSFVIFIILRYKQLHTATFYLALQITIINLINAIIIYPTSAANAIANAYVFKGLCPTFGLIVSFLRVARNTQMVVLVADRFFIIFMPFWYSRHRLKVMLPQTIGAWIVSLVFAVIPASGLLDCYGFEVFTWSCEFAEGCKNIAMCSSYRTFVTTFLVVGLMIAFLLYIALLVRARKLQNKVEVSPSCNNESQETRRIIKRKRKSERKANMTFLIMLIGLVGVILPPFLFFSIGNAVLNGLGVRSPPPGFVIAAIIARSSFVLIVVFDPIVLMRNEDMRQVIKSIIDKLTSRDRSIIPKQNSSSLAANND